jgi:hypothetical protein
VTGGRFNSTRSVAIEKVVIERECLWYGPKSGLPSIPSGTPSESPSSARSLWIGIGCGAAVILVVVVILILSFIHRKRRRLASKMTKTLNPYTE